jgi:hypothetical protein
MAWGPSLTRISRRRDGASLIHVRFYVVMKREGAEEEDEDRQHRAK